MIVLENSISQNGAEFVALVETEKKKSISFFFSSSSFSSLQAALMCGNSRSNSHQRNGSWLAHNSVQECRHFAEKGNVFSHKNPTQCHDFRFENSQIKMTLNYSNKYQFKYVLVTVKAKGSNQYYQLQFLFKDNDIIFCIYV